MLKRPFLVVGIAALVVLGVAAPAFAFGHTINGIYHGIYYDGGTYHHAWNEHYGGHTDSQYTQYVETDESNFGAQICNAFGFSPNHYHCSSFFDNAGFGVFFTNGENKSCPDPNTGFFANDGNGICIHRNDP